MGFPTKNDHFGHPYIWANYYIIYNFLKLNYEDIFEGFPYFTPFSGEDLGRYNLPRCILSVYPLPTMTNKGL